MTLDAARSDLAGAVACISLQHLRISNCDMCRRRRGNGVAGNGVSGGNPSQLHRIHMHSRLNHGNSWCIVRRRHNS